VQHNGDVQRDPSGDQEIAGYRIIRPLGEGGMGAVFLAEDPRLGRRVALKVLRSELAGDDVYRKRFLRESKLAATVDHPNIIPIYQADEADGVLYIAMRYVEGVNLSGLIREQGRLDLEPAVWIISQVGSALDAAHDHGLVHRDVKPSNILIAAGHGGLPHAYLADFGLIKRVRSDAHLTGTGQILGTIDYTAPEQIQARAVDPRADIYSLGCVLYQCLTGSVPFPRDQDVAVMWAHLQEQPPSMVAIRTDLPSGLDGVLSRAMAKSPDDRFSTCGEFVAGLRAQMDGTVVKADVRRAEENGDARADAPTQPARLRAGPFDVFLSYNRLDRRLVREVAKGLDDAGVRPWFDEWHLAPGDHWPEKLEAAVADSSALSVFVGPGGMGDWGREEIRLAREKAASRPSFRLFPVLLPGVPEPFDPSLLPPFLAAAPWVDLRDGPGDEVALASFVEAIRGGPAVDRRPVEEQHDDVSPYRGLQAFDEEHSRFFFGREGEIQRLLEQLKGQRFLAVLGPSGSGKSSLVRGGLVPAIRAGALPRSTNWTLHVLKPGANPLVGLTTKLLQLDPFEAAGGAVDRYQVPRSVARMRSDPGTLHLAVSLALAERPPGDRVMWVIDQFEEVFTLCRDEGEREAFVSNLLHAASVPEGRSVVVLTLRADFYPRCADYPALAAAIGRDQFLVSPMDESALRRAIEDPARVAGISFEPGLVETILDDVRAQPGGLPLLEHALLELWERRQDGVLTSWSYRHAGGVSGALSRRAEAIYDSLDSDRQAILRRMLLRLTQPGEGSEDTKRRASPRELVSRPEEVDDVDAVLDEMVEARLLTVTADEQTGERWVDVSHEALIRGWPRLREWIEQDRAGLRLHRRLTEAAKEWERDGRDDGLLFRGGRLSEALDWSGRNEGDLNEQEREFLRASERLREYERQEAVGRQQKELEDTRRLAEARRRANRALRVVALVLILGLVASATAAVFALNQGRNAKRARAAAEGQQKLAFSLRLAAEARSQAPTDLELSLALALKALESRDTPDAREALEGALAQSLGGELHGHSGPVNEAAFSRDGKLLTAGQDGIVFVWDVSTGKRLAEFGGHRGQVIAAFDPDGKQVVTADQGGVVRIWDVRRVQVLRSFRIRGVVQDQDLKFVSSFSPDARLFVARTGQAKLAVWEVASGKLLSKVDANTTLINGAAFSPDGKMFVAGGIDGTAAVWESASGEQRAVLTGHDASVNTASFSPNGRFVVTASDDGTARVWDASSGDQVSVFHHPTPVQFASFSPNSRFVLTLAEPGVVRVWEVGAKKAMADLGADGEGEIGFQFQRASFSLDGQLILAWGGSFEGQTLSPQVWAWRTRVSEFQGPEIASLRGGQGEVLDAAFSPDGSRVVTAGTNGMVRVFRFTGKKLDGHPGSVNEASFSPDGQLFATVGLDGTVRLWSVANRHLVWRRRTGGPLVRLSFSANGKRLLTLGENSSLTVWNALSGQVVGKLAGEDLDDLLEGEFITAMTLSPAGQSVALASGGGTAILWKLGKGEQVQLNGHRRYINDVSFSPNGKLLVSTSDDGTARVWDGETGRQLDVLQGLGSGVNRASFSPDGRFLVTGSGDGSVTRWDAETRKNPRVLGSHGGHVQRVTFSRDGTLIATAGDDGTLRVWNLATGVDVAVLDAPGDFVNEVGFSSDGRHVLAITSSGALLLRDLDLREEITFRLAQSFGDLAPFDPSSGSAAYVSRRSVYLVECEICLPFDELHALARSRARPLTPDERVRFLQQSSAS
jgi:WD40 repeat protein